MCSHGLYNSMVCAHTGTCTYQTDHRDIYAVAITFACNNVPLSSACTWTPFHHPLKLFVKILQSISSFFEKSESRNAWNNFEIELCKYMRELPVCLKATLISFLANTISYKNASKYTRCKSSLFWLIFNVTFLQRKSRITFFFVGCTFAIFCMRARKKLFSIFCYFRRK